MMNLNWPLFDSKEQRLYFELSMMTELLILSLRLSPVNLRRKLISAACIRDLALSVTSHSLWRGAGRSIDSLVNGATPNLLSI